MQDLELHLQQQQQQQQQLFRSGSPDIITFPYPLCKSEEERLRAMSLKPNQVRNILKMNRASGRSYEDILAFE